MTMTKVTDLLRNLTSSSDFWDFDGGTEGWMVLLQEKSDDSGFGKLIDSIIKNGWEYGSSIGVSDGHYIVQGHHRLAAAILLGIDEIPVSTYGGGKGTVCAHSDDGLIHEFDLWN